MIEAEAISVFGRGGPLVHLVRRPDDDGRLVWREAMEPGGTDGGRPTKPLRGADPLTPDQLLKALRGPLGAD
jgi:hypothetical protein